MPAVRDRLDRDLVEQVPGLDHSGDPIAPVALHRAHRGVEVRHVPEAARNAVADLRQRRV
ncbi:hypothetical protein SDC9_195746 [bioreactor metagenome]|uniref:Uncharacterized protein n=1 Tax=bioreactor metagenome TaxID=1076179 RepID=A0A645I9X6_9ZZZZ